MTLASVTLHGWRALPLTPPWETLALALYRRGERIATVNAFEDGEGPYYAQAIAADGAWCRLGAASTLARAVSWAEERSGFRVGAGGGADAT